MNLRNVMLSKRVTEEQIPYDSLNVWFLRLSISQRHKVEVGWVLGAVV